MDLQKTIDTLTASTILTQQGSSENHTFTPLTEKEKKRRDGKAAIRQARTPRHAHLLLEDKEMHKDSMGSNCGTPDFTFVGDSAACMSALGQTFTNDCVKNMFKTNHDKMENLKGKGKDSSEKSKCRILTEEDLLKRKYRKNAALMSLMHKNAITLEDLKLNLDENFLENSQKDQFAKEPLPCNLIQSSSDPDLFLNRLEANQLIQVNSDDEDYVDPLFDRKKVDRPLDFLLNVDDSWFNFVKNDRHPCKE